MIQQLDQVTIKQALSRLVPSRFPTVGVFDELADSEEELRILFNLEMLTNERINAPIGRLEQLPEGSVVTGESAHQIMAAWVHCHDDGGRFNDGLLGAWYGSLDVETAIDETVFHLNKRLSLSESGFPQQIQMRELRTTLSAPVSDICGQQNKFATLYNPESYTSSQSFARGLRWPYNIPGIDGIQYDSVRSEGGTNVCVFRPAILNRPLNQSAHYQYQWNAAGELFINKMTPVKKRKH